MNLLERLDLALQHARKSRAELASGIGLSRQAISNLRQGDNRTLKPENVARAARFLKCDLYWLCTGEGGDYVPEEQRADAQAQMQSFITREVVRFLESMSESDRARAFAVVYQLAHGRWPPETGWAEHRPRANGGDSDTTGIR